jgi:hypothetical protein
MGTTRAKQKPRTSNTRTVITPRYEGVQEEVSGKRKGLRAGSLEKQ